jgi:hypothetical protein
MFFAVRLERGGPWDWSRDLREQSGWEEHARFMDSLVDDGFIILGGPLAGERAILHAISAPSEQAVRDRLGEDNWSRNGMLSITSIEPWTILLDGRRAGAPAAPPGSDLQGLFARLFARPSGSGPDRPLTEVVSAWGIEIARGEEVTFLAFGQVAGRYGYIVVTGERFLFVEHDGSKIYRLVLEHSRESIVSVEAAGRRRRITLRGADFAVEIDGLTRDMAEAVRRHLAPG